MIVSFLGCRHLPACFEVLVLRRIELRRIFLLLHLGQQIRLNFKLSLASFLLPGHSVMVHLCHVCHGIILEPTGLLFHRPNLFLEPFKRLLAHVFLLWSLYVHLNLLKLVVPVHGQVSDLSQGFHPASVS